jgi:hypothetical protein
VWPGASNLSSKLLDMLCLKSIDTAEILHYIEDIHAACGGTNEERKWALAN